MAREDCECALTGMDIQQALSDIQSEVRMAGESGALYTHELKEKGTVENLRASLRKVEQCIGVELPAETWTLLDQMKDEIEYRNEDKVGVARAGLEAIIRSTIAEACK